MSTKEKFNPEHELAMYTNPQTTTHLCPHLVGHTSIGGMAMRCAMWNDGLKWNVRLNPCGIYDWRCKFKGKLVQLRCDDESGLMYMEGQLQLFNMWVTVYGYYDPNDAQHPMSLYITTNFDDANWIEYVESIHKDWVEFKLGVTDVAPSLKSPSLLEKKHVLDTAYVRYADMFDFE